MPYDPTLLVQTDPPPGTYTRVRDLLGVDAVALPDSYLSGTPFDKVLRRANRYVPGWASLTQSEQLDFAPAVVEAFAAEAIERLKTLYAKGERSFAEQSGDYDWSNRKLALFASATAGFARTQAAASGTTAGSRQLLRAYGPSKDVPYVSPNPMKSLTAGNPWGVPGTLLP